MRYEIALQFLHRKSRAFSYASGVERSDHQGLHRALTDHFSDDDLDLIDKAFSARIDSQYYVNREVPDENFLCSLFLASNIPT